MSDLTGPPPRDPGRHKEHCPGNAAVAFGCLGCAVAGLLALSVLGLIVSGSLLIFGNPCFFKQFPPAYCTPDDSSANHQGGVTLVVIGLVLLIPLLFLLALLSAVQRGRNKQRAGDTDKN